jgi:hypothetical protein
MKIFDIFNPCVFNDSLNKANAELTEKDLTRIMAYLDQAKQYAQSTFNEKKAARLCPEDEKRKAAIDFILHKATTMCIYSPFNQEYQTDVSIKEVTQNTDEYITIYGTYETEPDKDKIGDYGSTITKRGNINVNLVVQLADLNVLSRNVEPPFTIGIQGWHKEITVR